MAYTAWSVVFGEQPTAAKWNQLGANDAGFKDGTNIDAGAIITAKIADANVTSSKLSLDWTENILAANFGTSSTSYVDTGMKVTLAAIGTWLIICEIRGLSASAGQFGVGQLYNQTTATSIPDTERLIAYAASANERMNTTIVKRITTTTINNVLRLNFKAGGAYTSTVESDPNGKSTLTAIRIG